MGTSAEFRKLSGHLRDLPSTSVNFPCSRRTFLQLLFTFRATLEFCVNLSQFSVCLRDLQSIFRGFVGPSDKLHQLSFHLWPISSSSVNFSCVCRTFRLLPSTFCAGPFINFCQISLRPEDSVSTSGQISFFPQDLPTTSLNIKCIRTTFHQFPKTSHTFGTCRPLPLTLRVSTAHSINLPQLYVHTRDLPSTSVNFLCIRVNFL